MPPRRLLSFVLLVTFVHCSHNSFSATTIAVCADVSAMPDRRHPRRQRTVWWPPACQPGDQKLCHSSGLLQRANFRRGVCLQCDGCDSRWWQAALPDGLADRSAATKHLYAEFSGRPHKSKRRRCPGRYRWSDQRLRHGSDQRHLGHQRIFRSGNDQYVGVFPADPVSYRGHQGD